MVAPAQAHARVHFGVIELDLEAGQLRKSGVVLHLPPQPFKVLTLLVTRAGELVTREEIRDRIWGPETFVDFEHGLNFAIKKIRDVLGDDADSPRYIETVPRRGYRFIAPVEITTDHQPRADVRSEMSGQPERQPLELVPSRPGAGPRTTPPPSVEPSLRLRTPLARFVEEHTRASLLVLAVSLILTAALVYWVVAALPAPTVREYTQLTHDGRLKWLAGTDGSRIYLVEDYSGLGLPVGQVSVEGGEVAPIRMPWRNMALLSFSSNASSLLMGDTSENGLDGPLWAFPTLGGSARRLAQAIGHGGSWSPNGTKLAYANGGDLFIANADGTAPQKVFSAPGSIIGGFFAALPPGLLSTAGGATVAWSPDGTTLRFTLADASVQLGAIWEVSADGSHAGPVFPKWHPLDGECCGSWTPDAKYFIFQSEYQIWARRETGSFLRRVSREPVQLTAGSISYVSPLPSKDGKEIFAVAGFGRGELERYDTKTGTLAAYLGGISAQDVAFSKDGKWIAYVTFPDGALWRSKADGSEKLQLTFPPFYAQLPAWSPNGQQIAFHASKRGEPGRRIYLVSSNGGAPQELMPNDGSTHHDPSWSPDGAAVLFGSQSPDFSIRMFDTKTRQAKTLPNSRGLYSPRWSPDGRYVVAMPVDSRALMLYDFSTREWSVLAKGLGFNYPCWSRNSEYIYFFSMADNLVVERFGMRARKVEPVADLRGHRITGYLGGWFGLTPDGELLLLRDTGTLDVVSLKWQEP